MSVGTTAPSPSVSSLDTLESVPSVGSETSKAAADAQVHAADTYSRGALRWGYFILLNAIAGAVAVAFFVAVFYADSLDPYLMGTYEFLLGHPGVTSALAFSPLACSLLVGYGYASRARKRKKLAAEREAARAAAKANRSEGAPASAES